jgi:hypothetical protein
MPNLSGFVIDSGLGDCPGLCGLWHPGLVGVPFSQDDRTRYGKQFFRASGTVVGAALFLAIGSQHVMFFSISASPHSGFAWLCNEKRMVRTSGRSVYT